MPTPRIATRTLLIIPTTLVVMIIPFLTLEERIRGWWAGWQENSLGPIPRATMLVAILASDIVLPIPSSVVGTYAGARFGTWTATCILWLGLNLGAVAGFLVGAWGSRSMLRRWTGRVESDQILSWQQPWGTIVLIAARGVPLLAEATVVLAGVQGFSWRSFLPTIILSNLGLAVAYASLGAWSETHGWLHVAYAVSAGLPLLVGAMARRWLFRHGVVSGTS